MHMRFSVIIPAYNVGKYLDRCINSILFQSYKEFEIIVVYDISTDNTLDVIRKYSNNNSVSLIENPEKKGLSYARNVGVSCSTGDYIIFVDADDYLASDSLERISYVVDKYDYPDYIYGNGNYEFFEGNEQPYLKNRIDGLEKYSGIDGIDLLRKFVLSKGLLWSAWGKAYKRAFWSDLDCISNKPCREDLDMGYKIMEHAKKIAIVPAFYYYRRFREGSLLNTFSYIQEDVFNDVMYEWLEYLKNDNLLDEGLKKMIMRRLNDEYCCALVPKIFFAKGRERKKLIEKGKRLRVYFMYPYNFVNRLISIVDRVFGFEFTCYCLCFIKKRRYNNSTSL